MKKPLFILSGVLSIVSLFASCSSDNEVEPSPESMQLEQNEISIAAKMQSFDQQFFNAFCIEYPSGNLAMSPLSARLFVSLLANSAEGELVNEITSALNTADLETVNNLSQKLQAYLPQADSKVKVDIANSVWYSNKLTISQKFEQTASRYYDIELFGTDMESSDAGGKINSWISKKTQGLIKDFVPEGDLGSTTSLMLNTLYYKGVWTDKFDKSQTRKETFHGLKKDVAVDMMHNTLDNARYYNALGYQAIKLPMGAHNRFEALLVMPDKTSDLEAFVFDNYLNFISREEFNCVKVRLSLPKFKLSQSKFQLDNILKQLGIKGFKSYTNKLFEEEIAGGMSIFQQAVVEVNEDGAEAAAVTGGADTAAPPVSEIVELTFDRPFYFFINETKTGTCLFAGRVVQL